MGTDLIFETWLVLEVLRYLLQVTCSSLVFLCDYYGEIWSDPKRVS